MTATTAALDTKACRPSKHAAFKAGLIEALQVAVYFAATTFAFFVFVVVLFQAGVFGGIAILFYRGIAVVALAAVVFAITLVVAGQRFGFANVRDAFSATLVASSLTFTFLTLGPVTVDRSISIFINGHMADDPDRVYSIAEIDAAFRDRYLTGMNQIARRMEEQRITGTVDGVGTGYRITEKGRALISTSRIMAAVFGADQRLLDGPKAVRLKSP